jgi:hypothetical protein
MQDEKAAAIEQQKSKASMKKKPTIVKSPL